MPLEAPHRKDDDSPPSGSGKLPPPSGAHSEASTGWFPVCLVMMSVVLAACGQNADSHTPSPVIQTVSTPHRPTEAGEADGQQTDISPDARPTSPPIIAAPSPSGLAATSDLPSAQPGSPPSEPDAPSEAAWRDALAEDGSAPPALISQAPPGVCNTILDKNNPLVSGTERHILPLSPPPAQGIATEEPTYGSCLVRITNHSETGQHFHRNDYSRRQAFNADSTLMILYAEDGYWHLYDAFTTKWIKRLNGLSGDAEPHWHPNNPNVIYYLPTNGLGLKMYKLDVTTNVSTLVSDMSRQVRAHWPDAHTAWTRSEGSPSVDARYWCFMTEHISNGQWLPRGVFTWDLKEKRIVGTMSLSSRPDHVSMSPTGQYCVISGDDSTGTRAYRRDFKAPYNASISTPYLQLHHKSEHSDLAYNQHEEDIYVSIDYQANQGDVFMVNLKTGEKTSLFPTYLDRTATAIHVSGKAFRKPGWVLISTYGESHADTYGRNLLGSTSRQWLHRKVFAVSLEKNPQIRSIAYAHSDALSYWAEPHATVNRDFTRILFNSTWNSSSARDVETYLAAIPEKALDLPAR